MYTTTVYAKLSEGHEGHGTGSRDSNDRGEAQLFIMQRFSNGSRLPVKRDVVTWSRGHVVAIEVVGVVQRR